MPNYSFLRQIVTEWQPITCFRVTQRDRGMGAEFGKKRYLFRIVYGGEHFCRVSRALRFKLTSGMQNEAKLESGPIFYFGGPWWPSGPDMRRLKVKFEHGQYV